MSDVVLSSKKKNVIHTSLSKKALPILRFFPNNALQCVADVYLSCVSARKTQISEVEKEMRHELHGKTFLFADGQLLNKKWDKHYANFRVRSMLVSECQ